MRTLEQAERDYDRALSEGARAVQMMDEKLRQQEVEARRALAAVVLACGGKVEVSHLDLILSAEATLIKEANPETGGITIRVNQR